MTRTVSFVVPTKDSARTLAACLRTLRAQDHERVEIVVVDNASRDETPRIAREFATHFLNQGPERSRQRNAGATAASGDILVFIDSDMVAPRSLAREVAAAFEGDPGCEGLVLPERSIGTGFWARCRILEKEVYLHDSRVEAARAFRRASFEQVGGYDEGFHGPEDWDLADRISRIGRIGRIESIVLHDEGRLSLRRDLQKKLYYGRSLAGYARRSPGGIARHVLGRLPAMSVRAVARDPVHGFALLGMKLAELAAVLVGMFFAIVRPSPLATGASAMGASGSSEDR